MEQLIEFYKGILKFMGLEANDKGQILNTMLGRNDPVNIEGKPLYLPTIENLRNTSSADKVYFHPLDEIAKAESPVLADIVYTTNIRMNYLYYVITQSLMVMAESKAARDTLTPDAYPLLEVLKGVDEQMIINYNKLMNARLAKAPERCVLRIILKRGRTINDVRYDRGTNVIFHLLNDLEESTGNEVSGVKLREKDIQAYKGLITYVFPGAVTTNDQLYSKGVNSQTAPFLESLLLTGYALADKLNNVSEEFKAHMTDMENTFIHTEYMKFMDELPVILKEAKSRIPTMRPTTTADYGDRDNRYSPALPTNIRQPEALAALPARPELYPQQPAREEIRQTSNGVNYRDLLNARRDTGRDDRYDSRYRDEDDRYGGTGSKLMDQLLRPSSDSRRDGYRRDDRGYRDDRGGNRRYNGAPIIRM